MELTFEADVVEWRGPAPYVYAVVPDDVADLVHDLASELTYGWGVVPAGVAIGRVRWTTSLFPKDGGYLVPLRKAERTRAGVDLGDTVHLALTSAPPEQHTPRAPPTGFGTSSRRPRGAPALNTPPPAGIRTSSRRPRGALTTRRG